MAGQELGWLFQTYFKAGESSDKASRDLPCSEETEEIRIGCIALLSLQLKQLRGTLLQCMAGQEVGSLFQTYFKAGESLDKASRDLPCSEGTEEIRIGCIALFSLQLEQLLRNTPTVHDMPGI